MPMHNVERAAENVGKRARLPKIARFQVHRNDNVRAKQKHAFDGYGRRQKTIHKRAIFILDWHEEAGVSAGSTKRGNNFAVRIVDADAVDDVRGGDSQGRLQLFESFGRREAHEKFFMRWLVAKPSQEG